MKEKINDLLLTIKSEYPNGCKGLSCSECPLEYPEHPIGHEICEMLSMIGLTVRDFDLTKNLTKEDKINT